MRTALSPRILARTTPAPEEVPEFDGSLVGTKLAVAVVSRVWRLLVALLGSLCAKPWDLAWSLEPRQQPCCKDGGRHDHSGASLVHSWHVRTMDHGAALQVIRDIPVSPQQKLQASRRNLGSGASGERSLSPWVSFPSNG